MVHVSRAGWGLFTLFLLGVIRSTVGIDPCPSTAQSFNVTTTELAGELAAALNCSGGGIFDVLWEGTVIVNEIIALTDGSVVTIAGVGSGAIADGNGNTQLFTVSNATLYLADVGLENGYGFRDGLGLFKGGGGAIWVGGVESVVSWSGTTTFNNNSASDGGAVSVVDGAVASWSGNTSFNGNAADTVYGGAVIILNGASLSWSGQTNFTGNYAPVGGGAIFSNGSAVSWTGETTFVNNSANYYGGTILARVSKVSWSGVTSFENSTLRASLESGGTVQVEDSVLSWRGETSFNGSSGSVGGALHVAGSVVDWGGKTIFCDNVVDISGGALYSDSSSAVAWTGETHFCNNRADGLSDSGKGGAIDVAGSLISWNGTTTFANNSAGTGGAFYASGGATMSWGGATSFAENRASSNGGAVALVSEVSLEMAGVGTTVSLTGNVATIAGGAVYQSGNSFGLTWPGVSYVSNSALNGGAVYSVASGTASTTFTEYPNVYVNCTFRDNAAEASGGALESAAGKDDFLNVTFEANNAGALGGGIRVAGTTNLTRCKFVGNGANETGPAVASVGTISVTGSSFESNGLLCASGAFLNYTVEGSRTLEEVAVDYYNSVCQGCEECIGDCPVDGSGTQECIPALENTKSAGIDAEGAPITLEALSILPGYWRPVSSTATALPCWNEDACRGGVTDETEDCADGYRGPYCAICTDGYAATLAYTCSKCSSGEGIALAVVALLVALAAVIAVIFHLVSKPQETKNTRFRQLTQALPAQGIKTVVVAWQILTQFDAVANVTYGGAYGEFLDGISSIISLDVGLVLSAGCLAKTDFHDRLIISTLGPLFALGALGVSFQVAARRNQGSQGALQTVRRKHFSTALLVTFLVYTSVSSTVFRMFDCETLDDDREYLRADYTIECTMGKHKALQVYAWFMIMLYPIGIPVLYGIILFKHRGVLQDRHRRSVKQSADVEVTADLWKPYTPSRYYYEVVECARRVTLTGVVVFIYPNTAAQVAVTLVLAFVFVMVSESLAPYASKQDAWLSRVGHIVVFLSMFQALVLKVDVSNESSDSQQVFGGVLLAANICMVASVLAEATMVACYVCRGENTDLEESVAPGVRNTSSTRSVVDTWGTLEREGAPTSNDTVF